MSFKQANPERVLKRCDRFRDRRLGNVEMRCGPGHATPLNDGVEDAEVAQLEAPKRVFVQVHAGYPMPIRDRG